MDDLKPLYIPDASVILKWVFDDENDSKNALLIFERFMQKKLRLAAPSHLFYEITNVMNCKDSPHTLEFISRLLVLGIEEYCFNLSLAIEGVKIVKEFRGVSFYDAAYHALAIKLGGTFVTADEKYFQKTKKLGKVMRLKDYA